MTSLLRLTAEHEAAHAVAASHYGQTVTLIRVGHGNGRTIYNGTSTPAERAAICAAGDLWNREYGTVPYTDLGCQDLADFEREHGLGQLWQAQRTARSILTDHRELVLALADRLMADRTLRLDQLSAA